jgi:WXG100 family type VII secretion target
MAANVNVTYEQMQGAAKQLTGGQSDIDGQLASLKAQIDSLVADGYVTDSSSVAFQQSYEEFTSGARNVIAGLSGMASYLTKAASTFQETDAALASALRR